jgi:hypothetical protein
MRNHTGRCEDPIMKFDPGIGVIPVRQPLEFRYEANVFGPRPEGRHSMRFGRVYATATAQDPTRCTPSLWMWVGQ